MKFWLKIRELPKIPESRIEWDDKPMGVWGCLFPDKTMTIIGNLVDHCSAVPQCATTPLLQNQQPLPCCRPPTPFWVVLEIGNSSGSKPQDRCDGARGPKRALQLSWTLAGAFPPAERASVGTFQNTSPGRKKYPQICSCCKVVIRA